MGTCPHLIGITWTQSGAGVVALGRASGGLGSAVLLFKHAPSWLDHWPLDKQRRFSTWKSRLRAQGT